MVTVTLANKHLQILDVRKVQKAETCIIKPVQSKCFSKEMKKHLKKKQGSEQTEIRNSSQIYNLDSYLVGDGIIGVWGRLDKLILNDECKHLIVLPKDSPI